MRRKGKVHPSPPPPPPPPPSSSSSVSSVSAAASSSTNNKDAISFLKLLPAAILAILSILSHEDREVLAYMISRSIKATNFLSSDLIQETGKKNSSKKLASTSLVNSSVHKIPTFDCECFDCYTSYWFKWDSSPNRLVIHQAIEAFEEEYFFYNKELLFSKKGSNKNKHNKKKDKMGRRGIDKFCDFEAIIQSPAFQELGFLDKVSSAISPPPPPQSESPATADADDIVMVSEENRKSVELLKTVNLNKDVKNPESPEHEVVVQPRSIYSSGGGGGGNNEKGLARKVLPDVLGLFSSRLWNLWGPNV